MAVILVVTPVLALVAVQTFQLLSTIPELRRSRALVDHTFEVITESQELDRALGEAERDERNYLVSGDEEDAAAYARDAAGVRAKFARLVHLTQDNADHQRRWQDLSHRLDAKLGELSEVVDIRASKGYEAARQLGRANVARDTMKGIDAVIDDTIASEKTLLAGRIARTAEYERSVESIAWAASALAVVIAGLGAALFIVTVRATQRAEAGRRSSEDRVRLLMNGLVDHAIYMLDDQGNIVDWNTTAERLKGYSSDEIVGQNFARFFTEEDRAAGVPERALETAAATGKYEAENWRVRKDGSRFWASIVIEPLRDARGRLQGFAKITRDLTEHLQQRQALEQARAALAQAQKMEALGQLSGGIAHDYNNLLHVIRNAVEILGNRLTTADPDAQRLLDMIQRNADRAAMLTQRLLAFSRRQPLEAKPVNPNKLVAGMAELLRHSLGEVVAMETVLAAGIWQVLADSNQLESAILNLAVNARDAMPSGGKLTIETANVFLDEAYAAAAQDLRAGQYVMIAVSDTGVGMDKEVAARAFDPFFTTKEVGKGTGLGLSQVYGFIKQSGGHVSLYSEPGQGTTLKMYLPRASETTRGSEAVKDVEVEAPVAARDTILVVEDADDVREFTVDVLRRLGYRVLEAADGQAALSILGAEPAVSLLFTDVGLPNGMNGRQLAEEACRRKPALKVLYTTGYARNAIVHHGRLDPGVELLVKPFTRQSLGARVRQLLKARAVVS